MAASKNFATTPQYGLSGLSRARRRSSSGRRRSAGRSSRRTRCSSSHPRTSRRRRAEQAHRLVLVDREVPWVPVDRAGRRVDDPSDAGVAGCEKDVERASDVDGVVVARVLRRDDDVARRGMDDGVGSGADLEHQRLVGDAAFDDLERAGVCREVVARACEEVVHDYDVGAARDELGDDVRPTKPAPPVTIRADREASRPTVCRRSPRREHTRSPGSDRSACVAACQGRLCPWSSRLRARPLASAWSFSPGTAGRTPSRVLPRSRR